MLSLGLSLLACRGVARSGSGSESDRDLDAPVVAVGERRLSKAQLADYWFHRYPEEYARTLDELVDEWVVWGEATRLGLRVPESLLEQAVEREVDARREQLRARFGPEADLAQEVRRAYGVEIDAWKATILRPRLTSRLLMERVIRLDSRRRDRVHVRVIVTATAAEASAVHARVVQGADFSLLARQVSRDPSARRGGDLPWISRGDLALPGVEAELFAAAPGTLLGPLAVTVADQPQWHVYRVIERVEAWPAGSPDLGQRVEQDLSERPVDQGEFERWRARLRRERGVRYFRPDGTPWRPGEAAEGR